MTAQSASPGGPRFALSRAGATGFVRRNTTVLIVWLLALAFFIAATISISGFTQLGNLRITIAQVLVLAFAAAGETIVIIGGGIDVSVQGVISGAAVLCAQEANGSNGKLIWLIPLIMVLAMVVGLVNGVGIVYFGVSPIMMTIASNVVVEGAVVIKTGFAAPSNAPSGLQKIAYGSLGGIPVSLFVLIILTLVMAFVLGRTAFGRRLYSVGSSPVVSLFSGLNPRPVTIVSYMLSAIGAACAGLVLLSSVGSATLGIGDPYLFTAIGAVAVGGVSIVGGYGGYSGVLAAAIVLTLLTTILTAKSFSDGALDIVYGLAILVCVWLAARRTDAY